MLLAFRFHIRVRCLSDGESPSVATAFSGTHKRWLSRNVLGVTLPLSCRFAVLHYPDRHCFDTVESVALRRVLFAS